MNQQELIGLLGIEMLKIKHTLIVLELNIFKKRLENSLEIKILRQIFIEYKHTIQ